MPPRPGETFGRYQLADALGKGAMGEVYRAYDTVLHRHVALKLLTSAPDVLGEAPASQGAARILREARSAAGITHPNAVAIFDVGEAEGVPFLAMELVAGRTLRSYVGDASVPPARRVRWLVDVALALGAAHALGLVHRDIKPENVMVSDDGFVKVLDFGIARRAVTKEELAATPGASGAASLALSETYALANTLTADGVIAGTPLYMAPEQLKGEALDGRTDQFAWGVLAYEVLTGEPPWTKEWPLLLTQILSKEVTALPGVPARVDAVVRRALQKSPEKRFAAMEEIAAELEPYAAMGGWSAGGGDRVSLRAPEGIASARTEYVATGEVRAATRWRGVVAAAIAIVVAAGAVGVSRVRAARVARSAPDASVAVAEAPSKMSTNAEATAAYVAGVKELHDAVLGAAGRDLGHAAELDPLFGAAHLRLAIERLAVSVMLTGADLQPARNARSSLSEHDRVLLDAIEPYAITPPDLKESQRRFEAALVKYPSDPELLLQLAYVFDNSSQPERAGATADLAIAADPTYALAWVTKGDVAVERDDIAAALDAFGQCSRVSPGATTCLGQLSQIQKSEGKCVELVDTSRKLGALLPDGADAYELQAMALLGSGAPIAAAGAALQRKWDHIEGPLRQYQRLFDEAALAIFGGDFGGAEARYAELETMTASVSDEATRLRLVRPRMLLDLEVGRFAEATRLAGEYLRQRSGWMQPERRYDTSLGVTGIELAAGGITRSDFNRIRDQWLTRNNPDVLPVYRWVDAYASPASTPEDGAAALAAMPDARPLLTAYVMAPSLAEPIGRAYLLGGKPEEAASLLTTASASCDLTSDESVIFSTWAAFDLGQAREALGDTSGACAAYQRVLGRWGSATPRSRTAVKSRARRTALRCPP